MYKFLREVLTNTVTIIIRLYQRVSVCFPPKCRFYPSCSHYTLQSIEKYGLLKGGFSGISRICKCHPFHPGGYDPVK
jgi:putative membrane protein insertion efficiency factor